MLLALCPQNDRTKRLLYKSVTVGAAHDIDLPMLFELPHFLHDAQLDLFDFGEAHWSEKFHFLFYNTSKVKTIKLRVSEKLTEPTYSDKLYNSKQRRLYPTDSNDAEFDFY